MRRCVKHMRLCAGAVGCAHTLARWQRLLVPARATKRSASAAPSTPPPEPMAEQQGLPEPEQPEGPRRSSRASVQPDRFVASPARGKMNNALCQPVCAHPRLPRRRQGPARVQHDKHDKVPISCARRAGGPQRRLRAGPRQA
jgi:hypothetical protein